MLWSTHFNLVIKFVQYHEKHKTSFKSIRQLEIKFKKNTLKHTSKKLIESKIENRHIEITSKKLIESKTH